MHICTQPLDISLSPGKTKHVTLDQQVAEAEGYYGLLQQQVQNLSTAMDNSEEAGLLKGTAKDMLEALRQCIHIIKDSELTETVVSEPGSLEPTPPPLDPDVSSHTPSSSGAPSLGEAPPPGNNVVAGGVEASPGVERSTAIRHDEAGGDNR